MSGRKHFEGSPIPTMEYIVAAATASAKSTAIADFVCDGVNDDVEIQAAINALDTNQGGTVRLTEGIYNLGATLGTFPHNFRLEGAGGGISVHRNNSILQQMNGKNLAALVTSYQYNPILKDFCVVGNSANNTTTIGILVSGATVNSQLINVSAYDCPSHGFDLETNGYLLGCYSENNVGSGYYVNNASSLHFYRCDGSSNTLYGVYFFGSSKNSSLTGCSIHDNVASNIRIGGTSNHISLIGSSIRKALQHGIFIDGANNITINGCHITDNGTSGANTYDSIKMNNSLRNIINANNISLFEQAVTVKYCIEETGTSDKNIVSGNVLKDAQTAATAIIGAGSVSVNNVTT